ncbi:MAG: DUF5011 domain-containing protein, partial [Gammaproteobacteria bacterium]|nr:DUF5011 domain-containing protein [Gammaproteobacteria bacterium]
EQGSSLTQAFFNDITYSPISDTFVVVGSMNYAKIGGGNWQQFSLPGNMVAVTVNETTGRFVAVADYWKIQYSDDGLNWTAANYSNGSSEFYDVIYNPVDNLFFAVGNKGIETSEDGVTWILRTLDQPSSTLKSIIYDNAYGQYIATGNNGYVIFSTDGINWQTPPYHPFDSNFDVIVRNTDSGIYVVGNNGLYTTNTNVIRLTPDFVPPVYDDSLPVGFEVEATSRMTYISNEMALVTASDNNGETYIRLQGNSYLPVGEHTINWIATDSAGNTAEPYQQTVIIYDSTAPQMTLNGDREIRLEAGSDYSDDFVTITDSVDREAHTRAVVAGTFIDTNNVGEFTITYNVADASGNEAAEIVRTIILEDTTLPVFSSQLPDILYDVSGETTAVSLQQPSVTDLFNVTVTNDAPEGGFPLNETIVTWTATDANGNTATAAQKVIIYPDTTAPIMSLNGPAEIDVIQNTRYVDQSVRTYDQTDKNLVVEIDNPVDTSKVGTYTVTYNVKDFSGNRATELFRTVNVVDKTAPVITVLGEKNIAIEAGTEFTDPGATATDNVDNALSVIVSGTVNTLVADSYTISYTATDSAGNSSYESRSIRVFVPDDLEAPTILVPEPITLISLDGNAISFDDPRVQEFLVSVTATDNVAVSGTGSESLGSLPLGESQVKFHAYDTSGNMTEGFSTITVIYIDTTPPEITIPQNIHLISNDGNGISIDDEQVQQFLDSAVVSDNFGQVTVQTSDLPPTIPIGETVITFTAIDDAGNEKQVTATIIITVATLPSEKNEGNESDASSGNDGGGGSLSWFIFIVSGLLVLTRRVRGNI